MSKPPLKPTPHGNLHISTSERHVRPTRLRPQELGSLDIDAYNEAAVLGRKFLAKEYLSQSGEKLILMKCIDFYHSKELDQLARRYANKK